MWVSKWSEVTSTLGLQCPTRWRVALQQPQQLDRQPGCRHKVVRVVLQVHGGWGHNLSEDKVKTSAAMGNKTEPHRDAQDGHALYWGGPPPVRWTSWSHRDSSAPACWWGWWLQSQHPGREAAPWTRHPSAHHHNLECAKQLLLPPVHIECKDTYKLIDKGQKPGRETTGLRTYMLWIDAFRCYAVF